MSGRSWWQESVISTRRLRRGAVVTLGSVLVMTTVFIGSPAPARADVSPPKSLLTQISLGAGTQLDAVDMLSARSGVALAHANGPGANPDYLVRTSDAARTWHFVARLALRAVNPSANGDANMPVLHFVTPRVGYLDATGGLYVTSDAGATWSQVALSGVLVDWRAGTHGLAAIVESCGSACSWQLVEASLGATSSVAYPAFLSGSASHEVVAMTRMKRSIVVSVSYPTLSRGAPRVFELSGASATSWGAPCTGRVNAWTGTELLSVGSTALLYCWGDVAMNQGSTEIWARGAGAPGWTSRELVVFDHPTPSSSLGTSEATLGVSGRRLFALSEGVVSGLLVSVDGARTWSGAPSSLLRPWDGAFGTLQPWGRGVLVALDTGQFFGNVNGGALRSLSLPSGRTGQSAPWCAPPESTLSIGPSGLGPPGAFNVALRAPFAEGCVSRGPVSLELISSTKRVDLAVTPWPATTHLGAGRALEATITLPWSATCRFGGVTKMILHLGPEVFAPVSTPSNQSWICAHGPLRVTWAAHVAPLAP